MDIPTPRRRLDDRHPRRMRKGMYILPSLFTTANMAAGFYALLEVVHASAATFWHLDNAAKAIGFAVLFDGIDGRVARMTGTSSDFGKELDSLADVITFGVAPAMLAWTWGFHLMSPIALTEWNIKLTQLGAIASFLFLMAGASRLARFNITTNPQPSNPGAAGEEIFCRHADSSGRRSHCGGGSFPVRRSPRFLVYGDHVAGDGCRSGLSDGQYLALLQFQRHRFPLAPSLPPDDFVGRSVRGHLVLLEAGAVRGCAALYALGRVLALAVDFPPPEPAAASTYKEASQTS